MASIREGLHSDGTPVYYVLYRDPDYRRPDGKPKQSSQTLYDLNEAELLVKFLNANGQCFRLAEQAVIEMRSTAPTLNDAFEHWITNYSSANGTTKSGYRITHRRHIKDSLGRVRLDVLKREHVIAWHNDLNLAAKYNVLLLVSATLKMAANSPEWPCKENVAQNITSPKGKEDRTAIFLLEDQYRILESTLTDLVTEKELNPAIPIMANSTVNSGVRFGESAALRAHVDVTARPDGRAKISVTRSFKIINGVYKIGGPKTPRSRRDVILPMGASETLLTYMEDIPPGQLLFQNEDREPLKGDRFRQVYWYPLIRRIRSENQLALYPRFHDLRHTHAAWLIRRGVDIKTLQHRLGHEKISTTYDTYGHLYDDADVRAAALLDH